MKPSDRARRALTVILAAAATCWSGTAAAKEPVARVAEGKLRGEILRGTDVRRFAGLPYAQPPVGALRWHAPIPPRAWRGTRDATGFGARCEQPSLFADMVFRSPGAAEDCLFLNVWAPPPAATKRPVLVYLHGGGFVAGSGDEPRYDGASLAMRGIVVVTINYRLGTLGFLAHPDLTAEGGASGNYGLLDQVAALAWVRRNIAAFGGDPAQVTVAGESAGSMSVNALMASPLARGLFARAIGESGAMMTPTITLPSRATAETDGATLAGTARLPALRALTAAQVMALGAGTDRHPGPIVDGRFLTEDVAATFAAGRQASVPLLVGSNSQEGSWQGLLRDAAPTMAGYRAALQTRFAQSAPAVEGLYPAASDAAVVDAATALVSDLFIGQSTWSWFDRHRQSGAPTYYYLYAHPRPRALAEREAAPATGAVHSAEIQYALGNLHTETSYRYAWTPDDDRVSSVMQGYFANFILTGDPNGAGLPRWAPALAGEATPSRQRIALETRAEPVAEQSRHVAAQRLLLAR